MSATVTIRPTVAAAKRIGANHIGWSAFKRRLMEALGIPADQFDTWEVPAEWVAAYEKANRRSKGPTKHPCKVGSQPWLVIFKAGSKPKVGRSLTFRRAESGTKWMHGIVTRINDDGHFFVSLM